MVKSSISNPIKLVGGAIEGVGRGVELISQPKKTLNTFKNAPAFTLNSFGDYSNPSKASMLLDIGSPGMDLTDVAKYGIMGAVVGGARNRSISQADQINSYLKNAYKVYSGQKPEMIIANLADDVVKRTNLPKDIVVKKAFFDHISVKHPEIDRGKLFDFVKTLNIPDEIYQLPIKAKLNFFRKIENDFTNIVGTLNKKDQQVVTSFLTNSKNYPENIKKTAKAVYLKSGGGTPTPSSLMQSPPAGEIISGVSQTDNSIRQNVKFDKELDEFLVVFVGLVDVFFPNTLVFGVCRLEKSVTSEA